MNLKYIDNEDSIRNEMINKLLVITAAVLLLVLIFAEIRSINIGWTMRDLFQIIIVLSIVLLAAFRKYLPFNLKSISLIVILTIGIMPGVYTLGMLGGTIFIFPIVTVLVAIFYSRRVTQITWLSHY